ncbi:hypothetical protein [Enterobacter asburiae]|nr:hypothetical protein [Enterobacter asburiae]
MSTLRFSKAPEVMVLDNRSLTVRGIAYHRQDGELQLPHAPGWQ